MKVVINNLPIAAKNPNDMVAARSLPGASNCAMGRLRPDRRHPGHYGLPRHGRSYERTLRHLPRERPPAIFPAWLRNVEPVRKERNRMFALKMSFR